MQNIIEPINTALIEKELNERTFLRPANNGNNLLYVIDHKNAPHTLKEIGRLREITFRAAGGGTGKDCDLDELDLSEHPYKQLIVWDPDDRALVGGYRYIMCKDAPIVNGVPELATTEIFNFTEAFLQNYYKATIELGRSFVTPEYQPSATNRKGLFSLDNLWDGLGALIIDNPDIKYFFGKVTMYTHYNVKARDYILSFMNYFFPDNDKLVVPKEAPVKLQNDCTVFLSKIKGLDYKAAHKILGEHVRAEGEFIPPLVNAYMNLSTTMKTFGTVLNSHFGDVEETGILITIDDIYDSKKDRHVLSYFNSKKS
jgi:Acetyltransferase (GNAT) domain